MTQNTGLRTATEHIAWAKERALIYADMGETVNALASVASDLRKHPDTADHPAIELGMMLALGGHLRTATEMRDWIEGIR